MTVLKQNMQFTRLFMMIDSSDHVSGKTGLSPVVKLTRAGAAGFTAQFSPATEIDSVNLPGMYKILLSGLDLNTVGQLGVHCTGAGADPTDFIDDIQAHVFDDLQMTANGQAIISSNIKQNSLVASFPFVMTAVGTNNPMTGIAGSITAQRSLGGGGFSACVNAPTEIGSGWYSIALAASDTNSTVIALHFSASGANDTNITLYTQP